jgi:hypothetical protein
MENLSDDPKKLRLGWVIYEEVGIAIINDHAISRIDRIDASDTLSPRVVWMH